ncbi:hypothetical protein DGG96_19465 [Legionella qingyii]|uniref:Protein kinase domain-containing protein n=1 Tax=Legionella qingyii TaxID=2184757 RepID=A0A317TY71_9GAMM|nr:hypothetical protein [Legionella qingyii]PWY53959.1 hypothetical protein DGG96_19465 [Legionella qingyii]RUR18923.1 hypothetical protein ELY20_16230 [Legionella qingyii]
MLTPINNPNNHPTLHFLNEKIAYYNRLQGPGIGESLQKLLLLEIQDLVVKLKQKVDYEPDENEDLMPIKSWNEISSELGRFGLTAQRGLALEKQLLDLTSNISSKKLTAREWRNNTSPSFFGEYFQAKRRHPSLNAVDNSLKRLEESSNIYSTDCFYLLMDVGSALLDAINSSELNKKELDNSRILLVQINRKMSKFIKKNPHIGGRYAEHANTAQEISTEVLTIPNENAKELLTLFKGAYYSAIQKELAALLPALSFYELALLGSANNTTWKLERHDKDETICIRIERPWGNKPLVQKIRKTPLNEFLIEDYTNFQIYPYDIAISAYADLGNFRTLREKEGLNDPKSIIDSCFHDIGQLVKFSSTCLDYGVIYSDIKLTNFLMSKDRKLVISDHKSFIALGKSKQIATDKLLTSPCYDPPDLVAAKAGDLIDADKLMSYQLGLALYEYLVLPVNAKSEGEIFWTKQELDFNNPIFSYTQGTMLKDLIEQATEPNPQKRIGIKEFGLKWNAIFHQEPVAKQIQSLNYSYSTFAKGREHEYKVKAESFSNLGKEYQGMKGDALKTAILLNYKIALDKIETLDELGSFKEKIASSDEYQVLRTAQREFMRQWAGFDDLFEIKTSSLAALEELIEAAKIRIENKQVRNVI